MNMQKNVKIILLSNCVSSNIRQIWHVHVYMFQLVYGSVKSQEDHGYTIDLGIKGVQAFLPNKQAEGYVSLHNNGK